MVCEVGESGFVVRKNGRTGTLFTARRDGEWSYIAWEAPHARLPRGRL